MKNLNLFIKEVLISSKTRINKMNHELDETIPGSEERAQMALKIFRDKYSDIFYNICISSQYDILLQLKNSYYIIIIDLNQDIGYKFIMQNKIDRSILREFYNSINFNSFLKEVDKFIAEHKKIIS